MIILQLIALVFVGISLAQEEDGPIVETTTGFVQGKTVEMHYGENSKYKPFVNSFFGIPFGAPPIGDLRFERPIPADPWDGVLNATSADGLPTQCMQSGGGVLRYTHPLFDNIGEDCLNLNVFSPTDMEPENAYPVMVYFFGGAYTAGGNIQYPGHFYAARDVIAVTVNYRLGIFGFLNTQPGDEVALANAGLYDQVLALEWVRDNIAAFGGNPDQVTIFGQSAGASSSGLHTVAPASQGLFHGVIEQSGSDTTFWAVNWPEQRPWEYPQQVAAKFNCTIEPTADMIACLRNVDADELRKEQSFTCTPGHFCLGHAPVIDGPGGFLPDRPLKIRESGEYSKVPIFGGFNAEDGSLYVIAYIPEAMDGGFNRSEFSRLLYERFVTIWEDSMTPQQAQDAYWAVNYYYTPWPHIEDEDLNRNAFVEMTTDCAFSFPIDRQVKLQSEVAPSYMYVFGYRSTNASSGVFEDTEWAGVPHSGEIPYTFGWALLKNATAVRRDQRMFIDIVPWNEVDEEYGEFTLDLFSNFAKYFNPTPEPLEAPLGHGPITLPPLTKDELNYIWIHIDDVKADINYRQKEMAFFRDYISYVIDRDIYEESDTTPIKKKTQGLNTAYLEKFYERMSSEILSDYPELYDEEFDNDARSCKMFKPHPSRK